MNEKNLLEKENTEIYVENISNIKSYDCSNSGLLKPDYRERLLKNGVKTLSNKELIAVLLRYGNRFVSVNDLAEIAEKILAKNSVYDIESQILFCNELSTVSKSSILAALELGRRIYGIPGKIIKTSADVYEHLRQYAVEEQEHFICMSLNGAHELLETRIVSIGTANKTLVHPREVFSTAIKLRAVAIIVSHNHPSGQLEPSWQDLELNNRLEEAGEILGIQLLDHVIISRKGYRSINGKT